MFTTHQLNLGGIKMGILMSLSIDRGASRSLFGLWSTWRLFIGQKQNKATTYQIVSLIGL